MNRTEPLGIPGTYGRPRAKRRSSILDRGLIRLVRRHLGDPDVTLELWDGWALGPDRPVATVRILDPGALLQLVVRPMLACGDMYSAGRLEVDGDLVAGLEAVNRAIPLDRGSPAPRLLAWLLNGRGSSRGDVHHHYDLGNDFYRLWLDAELQYTCAYFPDPAMTLEQAQQAKMHHVCRKLRLQPGERVVEAGCGWGGFALFMARHYGVRVQAYNVSREQIAYARSRAAAEGLGERVEYVERDFREIRGEFDAFVSVGMLEHIGRSGYAALGRVIDGCLRPDGRGLIHSIGRDRPLPLNSWIRRRIFPGAYPPTLREMCGICESAGLSVEDVENLPRHYERTLRHWLERFESHGEEIGRMFDERFVRAWRLYLAGSIAAFSTGWLQLFQIVFHRSGRGDPPWSRAHLYNEPDA